MNTQFVYLLHFQPAYKQAGHYLGSTLDVGERLAQHRAGAGARLTQVAVEAGCELILARIWQGGRAFERHLKNQKHARRFCPICNGGQMGLFGDDLLSRELATALNFRLCDCGEMEF